MDRPADASQNHPTAAQGRVSGVTYTIKPEFLAGRYWWRLYVEGHPKVLVRDRDNAIRVGEILAADEAQARQGA